MAKKTTGVVQHVWEFLLGCDAEQVHQSYVISEFEADYTPTQIMNALNYLARKDEYPVERVGNRRNYTYIIHHEESEVDVLEDLLTAMAKAEPVLKKLMKARKLLMED